VNVERVRSAIAAKNDEQMTALLDGRPKNYSSVLAPATVSATFDAPHAAEIADFVQALVADNR
jgi:hypothetical protein